MSWTLCSEQDVRDIQPIPDTIPETWSDLVEGMIREHLGQTTLALTEATYTEYRSGDNSTFIRLKNTPVTAITSLSISDVAVGANDVYVGEYFVQLKTGVFTTGVRNVEIVYTAGGGVVTPDIRLAAAMMIVAMNNYYGRLGADASLKWATMMDDGRDHTRGGEAGPSKRMGLSAHLESIMYSVINQRKFKIA